VALASHVQMDKQYGYGINWRNTSMAVNSKLGFTRFLLAIALATMSTLLWCVTASVEAADETENTSPVAEMGPYDRLLDPEPLEQLGLDILWTTDVTTSDTPQLLGNMLYVVSPKNEIHALDSQTGKELWVYPLQAPLDFPLAAGKDTVCAISTNRLHIIDLESGIGKLKGLLPFAASTGPAPTKQGVWIMGWDGVLYRMAAMRYGALGGISVHSTVWDDSFREEKLGNVRVNASVKVNAKITVPVIIADGNLILLDNTGMVQALESHTREHSWERTVDTKGSIRSMPAIGEGMMYVGSDSYRVAAINTQTGDQVWRVLMQGPFDRPLYVLKDGPVLASATNDRLAALAPANGEELWSVPQGLGPVAASETEVIVEVQDKGIVSIDIATGQVAWENRAQEVEAFVPNASSPILYMLTGNGITAVGPAN